MTTFRDFCTWAGNQRKAAEALGLTESKVSRIANGKTPLTKDVAELAEMASGGLFKKERLLWPDAANDS